MNKKNGNPELPESALSYFWRGGTLSGNLWAKDRSESEIRAFYKQHKHEIIDFFIKRTKERGFEPGRRPELFWAEIREKRKRTHKEWYVNPWGPKGPDLKERYEYVLETDFEFLKRLNLLQGSELDWNPEKAKKPKRT